MKYVILSPPYRNSSAGIRVLYELQKLLIRSGRDAIVINNPIQIENYDIAIYPEIIDGNPLNAKRVIRYNLNKQQFVYDKGDIVVAYCDVLNQVNDLVLEIPVYAEYFKNIGIERTIDLAYVGKGVYTPHKDISDAYEITGSWPETRQELAYRLNQARNFYTYDPFTALTTEAMLCGCKCFLVNGENIEEITQFQPVKNPKLQEQLQAVMERAERWHAD